VNPDTPNTSVNQGPSAFLLASLSIADIIAAHDFQLREQLALTLIRKQSYGAGRTEAYIPKLSFFEKAMRVSRGNVSAILSQLKRQLVIEESPDGFYGFLPWQDWRVAKRTEAIEVIEQLELLERPPSIRNALREVFVEQAGQVAIGRPGQVMMKQGRTVPESGTVRTRIGNDEAYPNREHPKTVQEKPELLQPFPNRERSHDHEREHDCNSMNHEREFPIWDGKKGYDVGALGDKTGDEILAEVVKSAGQLSEENMKKWQRRIRFENPKLVWDLAHDSRRHFIRNRAGWMNTCYMESLGILRK